MTIHRSLALALALIAGVGGALIGRAVPRSEPSAQTSASASPTSSNIAPTSHGCNAERAELASTRAQLAVCMAINMRPSKAAPSAAPEASAPDPQNSESPVIRRNRELLEGDSEVVIVRRSDGTIGIYKADEWPSNGDGRIIGRKFPNGQIGWYSAPAASSPADPDAGPQPNPPMFRGTSIDIGPDGRLTVRGKPAPPWVERMLGGRVDEPAKP